MSLFSILVKVRMRFEKIQGDFLWGGGALENSEVVNCLHKEKKGGFWC